MFEEWRVDFDDIEGESTRPIQAWLDPFASAIMRRIHPGGEGERVN